MKIIAINLLVISSLFPQLHFLGIQVTHPEGSCSFGAFRSNLPPDQEAVSFIKMGWIGWHREVVTLPTNQMVFVKLEVFTPGKRLQLQGEVQREFSSLRGLIFVTKTCQEFIHLAAESFCWTQELERKVADSNDSKISQNKKVLQTSSNKHFHFCSPFYARYVFWFARRLALWGHALPRAAHGDVVGRGGASIGASYQGAGYWSSLGKVLSSKILTFPKMRISIFWCLTNATAKNTHPSSDFFLTALLLALVLALALDHAPDSS